jgi:thioredoxin-dependent peroxiredoxin
MMLDWLLSEPLAVGSAAPDFSLADDSGRIVKLSDLRGKNVVLVFYPGDDTPGCTRQLCQLRDEWQTARAGGVEVFGVNPQSARSHARFRDKHRLPFPLLVDQGRKAAKLYHASGLIVKRTVYLIGPDGAIRFARRGMPAPAEVLAAIA